MALARGIVLFLFVLSLNSCGTTTEVKHIDQFNHLNKIAKEYLGERFTCFPNSTNEYCLYTKKNKSLKDLFANVKYILVAVETSEVIFQDEMIAGGVKWEDSFLIRAVGRVPDTELKKKIVYFFDVKKRKKLD